MQSPEFNFQYHTLKSSSHTRDAHQTLRIGETGLHVPVFQVGKEHKGKDDMQSLLKPKSIPNGLGDMLLMETTM